MQEVSVIIPNYNGMAYLEGVLSSLEQQEFQNFETILVDNGSSDGSVAFTMGNYPWVHIIELPDNFGFSRAVNEGIHAARSPYVLLLNNDTEVISNNFIEEMMGYLQRSEVGVVGAKLYFRDMLTQHAGMLVGVHGAVAHVNQNFSRTREGYLARAVRPGNFSGVTGACQMVRREAFEKVGGYTESLAVGFNDIDFCLKLIRAGYRVVFTPYAELFHYEFVSRGREIADSEKIKRWERERQEFATRWKEVFEKEILSLIQTSIKTVHTMH